MNRDDIADLREQLRQSSRELREDIERREMVMPAIVYKVLDNSPAEDPAPLNGYKSPDEPEPPPFSDEQMDIIAATLAGLREEMRAEFADTLAVMREKLARCEGMLLGMLGGEQSDRSLEVTSKPKPKSRRSK